MKPGTYAVINNSLHVQFVSTDNEHVGFEVLNGAWYGEIQNGKLVVDPGGFHHRVIDKPIEIYYLLPGEDIEKYWYLQEASNLFQLFYKVQRRVYYYRFFIKQQARKSRIKIADWVDPRGPRLRCDCEIPF